MTAAEGDSLEAQENAIGRYVQDRQQFDGWKVSSLHSYIDAGKSGGKLNRPEIQKLLTHARQGLIDVVVVTKLDRVARNVRDFLNLWDFLKENEVELIILKEQFDTSNPMGEFLMVMPAAFAELERKVTGERTAATMEDRARRGLWNGRPPFGYVSDAREKGRLIPNQESSVIIRKHFFDAFEELGSAGAVQRRLLELGIRTQSRKSRFGKLISEKCFAKQQVLGILRNEVYLGTVRYLDIVTKNAHKPIISKQQFARVQRKLNQTAKTRTNHRRSGKRTYTLKGLIRCGTCGAMMTPKSSYGQSKKQFFYYECTRQCHEGGKLACTAPRLPAEALENAIIKRIQELATHEPVRDRIVQEALIKTDEQTRQVDSEIIGVRQRLGRIQIEIANLVSVLKTNGAVAMPSVQAELGRLEKEQLTLRDELERLNEQEAPFAEIREATRRFMENWNGVGELLEQATREEQAVILQHYIEVIELKPADLNGKTGTYALKLFPEVSPPDDLGTQNKNTTDPDDRENGGALTNSTKVRRVDEKAPPARLELHQETPGKTTFSESRGTESGTVGADLVLQDERLRLVIGAWEGLPEAAKEDIVALVRTAKGNRK